MGFNDAFMNFLNKGGTAPDPKDEKTAPENKENLPGKKKYIPPYTPERTPIKPEDSAKIIQGNPAKKMDNSATKLDLYKESLKRIGVATKTKSETTIQPPKPVDEPPPDQLPGKKKYIPPYTPVAPTRTKSFSTTPTNVRTASSSATSNFKPRTSGSFTKPSSGGNMGGRPQVSTGFSSNMNRSNFQRSRQPESDDEEDLVPIKRESSRRKAKEGNLAKKHMQERLLEDDEEGGLPGLDLSDSDDDATWDPSKEREANNSRSRFKRLASDDEDEMESYRSVVSTPKKAKMANKFHSTQIVPTDQDFRPGDFVVLRDESNQDQSPVWRFDSKTLLQRFNVAGKDENGDTLYKSANLFSGYIASNRTRYASVAVKFISSEGNATVVKVIQSASPDQQDGINPEIRKRSYGETSQFQENFEVYIQALISQCLDANFLDEVFNDADEYFVSNIEKVDSVTLLRKDKVMNGVSWSMRFQQALSTWPCLNDLGASAVQDSQCGVCDHEKATTMVQMFGQPYHQNTLKPVAPSEQASMNRNFSVCSKCSRLAQLYHKLYHQKHKMFTICADVVDSRKKNSPGLDTTRMLNELLADDQWLETNFRIMQDLWADADTFVR